MGKSALKKNNKQESQRTTISGQVGSLKRRKKVFVNAKSEPASAPPKTIEEDLPTIAQENTEWLLASASTFDFWDNELDAEYDNDM